MRIYNNAMVGALAGSALLFAAHAAAAQDFPDQPITWVAPSSPGSAFDVVARLITPKLSEALGESVVIQNIAGAGATVGASTAATARPDGYTILQANPNLTAAESLYKSLSYNLIDSFDPIVRFTSSYHVLVVNKNLEVDTLEDLIAMAKERPGELNFASAGVSSVTFMCANIFLADAGIDMTHIPYEGGGPAVAAVVSGEVDFYAAPYATAKPFIDSGEVKALAMTSRERAVFEPDMPAGSEVVPGFEFMSWYGLLAPKGTPEEIRTTIREAMATALADEGLKTRLEELGFEVADQGPEEFTEFMQQEIEATRKIIEAAGIEPQ